jgi:hypothetical protein
MQDDTNSTNSEHSDNVENGAGDHNDRKSDDFVFDATPEQIKNDPALQEKYKQEMQDYQKALQQEYEIAAKKDDSLEDIAKTTAEFLAKHNPTAAAMVVYLMNNSTSDGVRLNASKYIIETVRNAHKDLPGDPVADILKSLMAPQPTQPPNSMAPNSHHWQDK